MESIRSSCGASPLDSCVSCASPEGFAASSLRFSSAAGVVGGTGITEGFTTPGVAGVAVVAGGVAVAAGGVAASVAFWSVLDA